MMNRRTILAGALTAAAAGVSGLPRRAQAMGALSAIRFGDELAGSASARRLHVGLDARLGRLDPAFQCAVRESGVALRNAHAIATRAPCLAVLAGLPLTMPALPERARLERLSNTDVQQVLTETAEEAGLMVWPVGMLCSSLANRSRMALADDGRDTLKGVAIASLGLGAEVYLAMGATAIADPAERTRRQSAIAFDQTVFGDPPITGIAPMPPTWAVFAQPSLMVLTMPADAWHRMPTRMKAAMERAASETLLNEARRVVTQTGAARPMVNGAVGTQILRKTLTHVARAIAADWLGSSQKARKFATLLSNGCDNRIAAAAFA